MEAGFPNHRQFRNPEPESTLLSLTFFLVKGFGEPECSSIFKDYFVHFGMIVEVER